MSLENSLFCAWFWLYNLFIATNSGDSKMVEKVNIFDCDGVLLDSSHRYSTMERADGAIVIDLAHWIANEHKAYEDAPLPTALNEYAASLADPESYTIIATAAVICDNRIKCLRDKIGMPDYIIGRNGRADNRGGAELKIAGLRKLLSLKQFHNAEITMFEDNISYLTKIVKAFNCRGVYIPSVQGH